MTEPDGIRSGSPGQEVTGPWCGEGSGKGLAIRHSGDVLLGGAQEQAASCDAFVLSRRPPAPGAPAAIAPGQQPESHGAGVSRFSENGSHLA